MSRWVPWLAELQPELFIEISPELAKERGIENAGWVTVSWPLPDVERARIRKTVESYLALQERHRAGEFPPRRG